MGRLLMRADQWLSAAAEHLDGVAPDTPPPDALTLPDSPSLFASLRDNLTFDSLSFRHATRLAVTGATLVLLTNGLDIERGYWLTLSAVAVLQVYPSATWTRALERSAGSILGGLIAAAAAFVLHGPGQTTLIILPLTLLMMSVRGVSYALFVLFLTPTVVLIAELFQTGGGLQPSPGGITGARQCDRLGGRPVGQPPALAKLGGPLHPPPSRRRCPFERRLSLRRPLIPQPARRRGGIGGKTPGRRSRQQQR